MIEMIFRPRTGGNHADALIFEINAEPSDPTLPRPVVSVSGIGTGPEISVEPSVLNFASSGIGTAVMGHWFDRLFLLPPS